MQIRTRESRRCTAVALNGSLGLDDVTEIENTIKRLADSGKNNIILDLAGVDRIHGAGMSMMVRLQRDLQNAGGFLVLAQPSPMVFKALEICGLDVLFKVVETHEEAIGSF